MTNQKEHKPTLDPKVRLVRKGPADWQKAGSASWRVPERLRSRRNEQEGEGVKTVNRGLLENLLGRVHFPFTPQARSQFAILKNGTL